MTASAESCAVASTAIAAVAEFAVNAASAVVASSARIHDIAAHKIASAAPMVDESPARTAFARAGNPRSGDSTAAVGAL